MKHTLLSLIALLCITTSYAYPKIALIFGVTGQDGAYLTKFLLKKNYIVHGIKRRSSLSNTERLDRIMHNPDYKNKFFMHYGDLSDIGGILDLIKTINPDEIYNLAAQSNVKISFDTAEYTANINALGTLRILESIIQSGNAKKIRFYQASSSEMFGKAKEMPQSECTSFYPRSPYGVAKLYAHWITRNYRESYGIFACNGILFNHESPLRGKNFVTRKISRAVAKIYLGKDIILSLGNLDVRRDWGYAKDYVEAMWLMLQQDSPNDYVIATGKTHSVREFVEAAFAEIGITIKWKGQGIEEIGIDASTKKILITVNPRYFRPTEIEESLGNATKAQTLLKWSHTTSFHELVKIMVHADIKNLKEKRGTNETNL